MNSNLKDFTDNLNGLINDYNVINNITCFKNLDDNDKILQLRKLYNIFDYICLNYKIFDSHIHFKNTLLNKIDYFYNEIKKLELCDFNKKQCEEIQTKFDEIKRVI